MMKSGRNKIAMKVGSLSFPNPSSRERERVVGESYLSARSSPSPLWGGSTRVKRASGWEYKKEPPTLASLRFGLPSPPLRGGRDQIPSRLRREAHRPCC